MMSQTGSAVFSNLALLFAMGAAIGMARKEKVAAACRRSGLYHYEYGHSGHDQCGRRRAMPANSTTTMLGITTLQMGVFGGIVVGLGVAALHKVL